MPKKKAATRRRSATPKPSPHPPAAGFRGADRASIQIRGARQNNLKGIDLDLPLGKLNVITGPSGSGKSSLAFQTIYAEGQRRYIETFSPYTRQFFDRMDKPQIDEIRGIPPAIAIEQVNGIRSARSTVGTITEINDYLKLLFPRLAVGTDPESGEEVKPETPQTVATFARAHLAGQTALVTFPVPVPTGTDPAEFFAFLQSQGFLRAHIFGETYRTDSPGAYPRKTLPAAVEVIQDRVKITPSGSQSRLFEALESAFHLGKGRLTLFPVPSPDLPAAPKPKSFSTSWEPLRAPTPGLFSFNSPLGACPECRGFGKTIGLDLARALPDSSLSIAAGLVKPFSGETYSESQDDLLRCARQRGIDVQCPFEELPQDERDWVLYGEPKTRPEDAWERGEWYGVQGFFDWMESKAYKMHVRVFLSRYRSYTTCRKCRGTRLVPDALHFRVGGLTLPEMWHLPVSDLLLLIESVAVPRGDHATALVRDEVAHRLRYLCEVGLPYLDLNRETRSLSGGEIQRVNLTTCLGASLTNTLFVLDEPSIGLHPRDTGRLIGVMRGLVDKGNTLLVVEHEEAVIRAADHLIDIGPGRGEEGGHLVFEGDPRSEIPNPAFPIANSLTLQYLHGQKSIPVPKSRRRPDRTRGTLTIRRAAEHNLQHIDVEIPLGIFTCVTGVSGSGKSTLVHHVLYENLLRTRGGRSENQPGRCKAITGTGHLGDIVLVDQSPLSRTPRSTPAVYIGAFDLIRTVFANTDDARSRGLTRGFFSFNSGGGRCERCAGTGYEKVEMQFLSDLYVLCPECSGRRYQKSTLEVTYRGHSIADVLDLTVSQSLTVFQDHPRITALLQPLADVGLSYLRLGQPLNTLSGGESQRLKLVSHLLQNGPADPLAAPMGSDLLIFDEPTTGLHFDDIALLLTVFQKLVAAGATVLVIEHNLDVIKCADHLIDLGPEGGNAGGRVVATGTPEQVAKVAASHTGRFLANLFAPTPALYPFPAESPALQVAEVPPSPPAISRLPSQNGNAIHIHGAREHNLKNISLSIPRDEFVVVTGLSGSGKSTLAFDIIFAEGQRRFLDSMSAYARQFLTQMEKPDVDSIVGLPPTVAIEQRVSQGGGKSTVATVTEVWQFLRLLWSKVGTQHCPDSGVPVISQTAAAIVEEIQKEARRGPVTILAPLVKGRKGFHTEVAAWAGKKGYTHLLVDGHFRDIEGFQRLERFREHDIDVVVTELLPKPKTPLADLRDAVAEALALGKGTLKILASGQAIRTLSTRMVSPATGKSFEDLDPRMFSYNSPHGWCPDCRGYGVIAKKARQRILDTDRFDSVLAAELDEENRIARADADELVPCPTCHGARINEAARHVMIAGNPIQQIAALSVRQARQVVASFSFEGRDKTIARDILPEITQRLKFMEEVGLGYLQLDRSAKTLSGGEAQRIRLAAQLGSNLTGVLYVLDEPTIGLHPRDNVQLLDTLTNLQRKGNSLLIVEHDEDTIARADTLLDLGPGAGRFGGELVYQGRPSKTGSKNAGAKGSPTLQALALHQRHPSGGVRRALPKPRAREGWLRLKGASAHNLKNIDVQIPLARLTVITGISGSGKSTLMRGVLHPAVKHALTLKSSPPSCELPATIAARSVAGAGELAAIYEVDQSPIGKTSRSCPATYIKVFDEIRKLFSGVPLARMRGYTASRFSFNTEGGRCETCRGNGAIKLEMTFLPTTWVPCEDCKSLRYNEATLEVDYHGKSIGEVMQMSIAEAADFFSSNPKIHRALALLKDTGTGYLQLGQPSPTLSGGEAQRIKLVTELTRGQGRAEHTRIRKNQTPKGNLYLIEEPTIGLHMTDVAKLVDVLHRLVDEGHTVIVIEHNLDVMAEADYLVDIGPEAGAEGGTIVASGTPEVVARNKTSRTAPFLRSVL